MKDNKLVFICILILSVSIVLNGIFAAGGIKNDASDSIGSSQLSYGKALMTEKEAAEYLGLPSDKFHQLLTYYEAQRKQLGSFDTFRFLPHITIDDEKYFYKEHLDKWAEYNSLSYAEIDTDIR